MLMLPGGVHHGDVPVQAGLSHDAAGWDSGDRDGVLEDLLAGVVEEGVAGVPWDPPALTETDLVKFLHWPCGFPLLLLLPHWVLTDHLPTARPRLGGVDLPVQPPRDLHPVPSDLQPLASLHHSLGGLGTCEGNDGVVGLGPHNVLHLLPGEQHLVEEVPELLILDPIRKVPHTEVPVVHQLRHVSLDVRVGPVHLD